MVAFEHAKRRGSFAVNLITVAATLMQVCSDGYNPCYMYKAVTLKYNKSCTTLAAKPTMSKLNPNARHLISFCDEIIDIPICRISNKYEHSSITLDPSARNVVPSRGNLLSFSDVRQIESIPSMR